MPKTFTQQTMTIPVEIPIERVVDLLMHGLEDGHSWMRVEKFQFPKGTTRSDFAVKGRLRPDWAPSWASAEDLLPFVGGAIIIEDCEDGESTKYVLDGAAIEQGLKVMVALKSNEGGHHFGNFRNEEDDAETGYVFLQCCVLPDVIKDGRLRYG